MLVAMLLLLAMVVFAGTAAAGPSVSEEEDVRFKGAITNAADEGVSDAKVQIEKRKGSEWKNMGKDATDDKGHCKTSYKKIVNRQGRYRLIVDGEVVDKKCLKEDDFNDNGVYRWTYRNPDCQIPEFATVAIPAIALLGLVAFHRRKKK